MKITFPFRCRIAFTPHWVGLALVAWVGLLPQVATAQPWMRAPYFQPANPDQVTLADVRAAFDAYWQHHTPDKGKGIKVFRRWEWIASDRLGPNGELLNPNTTFINFEQYRQEWNAANPNRPLAHPLNGPLGFEQPASGGTSGGNGGGFGILTTTGNWTSLGSNSGTTNLTGQPTGQGRVNCVAFHPTDSNTYYVGTPAGGIWKTTNNGASYTPLGDGWSAIGVSSIAIHPTNPNTLFVVTGDKDATDTPCIGVLKSTNGGTTWTTTGITYTPTTAVRLAKIIIDPTTPTTMLVCGDGLIRRTTDGGNTWSTTSTAANFCDIEFKPGNSNIVYASTRNGRFYKSTNNGQSWTQITSGMPTSDAYRTEIAVSANNANYVYLVIANGNDGLKGVYRSTDSGTTFSLRMNSPNLLGYQSNGSDSGGQGWYDLDIIASPTNAEEVWVGGINIWRSTNGGTNFSLRAHWTGSGGAPALHADQHFFGYSPVIANCLYIGHDGGLHRTVNSGTSYQNKTANMAIGQIYRMGQSPTNSSVYIVGLQDNGTQNHLTGGPDNWRTIYGGDGVDCAIDPANTNLQYGSYVEGKFFRTTNGGSSTSTMVDTTHTHQVAAWVAPLAIHPTTSTTLYTGYTQLWRSTTGGTPMTSWTQVSSLSGTTIINFIAIAPSAPTNIWLIRGSTLLKSTNGGTTFSTVTQPSGPSASTLKWVHIHPTDANKVWLVYSNYSATNKVFYSTNGGTSWTNITGTLPNIPANCIVYQAGSANNTLYLGMDAGVYVRDDVTGNWQPFMSGLPNVIVNELEIHANSGKIRAATYGRGLWESDLYSTSGPVVNAQFSASDTTHCVSKPITFTDLSTGNPTSWAWTFPSGTPATSTQQNPTATWTTPGTYTVQLIASNATSSDTATLAVTITAGQTLPYTQDFETSTAGMLISNPDGNITWEVTNTLQNVAANNGTNAARVRNYDYNAAGQRDFLFTPSLDLRSYNTVNVSFQHCYRLFTGYPTDTLRVWVFSNCDSLWTLIQTFIGNPAAGLATGDTLTINHRTNPNQTSNWCYATGGLPCQNLNISAFAGQPNVRVVFENATAYGNDLYLDNINITGTVTAPPTASFTKSSATVCAGGTITFTDNSTGSVTTRSWTFNGGSPASGSGTTHTVTFNTPGTYNITLQVTGPGGSNSTTQQVTVYANPTLNATPSNAICTANNGSVTLAGSGGQTPYQYSLNGGTLQSSGSFSNLAPGSYTALVQDNRGCQGTATFNIGVTNTTLTVGGTPTSTSCHGGSNGQIVASASGGTAPYQYSLDAGPYQSNATFTGLSAGSYAVNARDANGCTGTTTVVVGEPSALSLNATPTASTSCATPNGQVVLTGSGGTGTLQYSLDGSSFQSSGTFTNLAPGTYTATVRDANNCTTTSSFAIGSPATFTPNASASHVTCNGLANGGLTVSVTPAGTYQYSLDGTNFQPSNQFTGLAPGNYTVTVRDGNSCTATATATVTEPAALTMSLGATNATGPATADGSVDASVAGGTPAYSYSWSNGATTEDLANVAPGVYILNVTDANGCQLADTATVGFTVGRPDAQEAFFQLFPNPTHGDVTVRGPFSAQSPAIAVVYDAAGREVARLQLAQPEQTLNLSLATGLYEVAITHTGKTARVKLIVR